VPYFDVYRPLITPPRNGAYDITDEQSVVVFNANSRRCGQPFRSDQSKPVIRERMERLGILRRSSLPFVDWISTVAE
jgi:hypothetical protein